MRLAVVFTKEAPVRFVSHLDVQRLFQRAFRRAKLPLAYSQGFNPHPLVSFATALSVGMTSRGEYLDVTLAEELSPHEFTERVQSALPAGVRIIEAFDMGASRSSLTSAMRSAEYAVNVLFERPVTEEELKAAVEELLSGEIVVQKKTKGGIKPKDIRPMILEMRVNEAEGQRASLYLKGVLSAEGGLNPDVLMGELYSKLGVNGMAETERLSIEMDREALLA